MISAEECCLNLSDLPSDIIRNVIISGICRQYEFELVFKNLIATISPRHLVLTDSYAQLVRLIYTECPVLVHFYWKLTQIVSEIECVFACSEYGSRNINRNHCEELNSENADICKIATELVPYSHY
ncbi:hypothetical protein PRIPAC_86652 [Pristionchus pacificus]|uniref:Uncharacterized protein n=1 Tax=Pristionchus pacificus TaxID=54126 RepID=A0A2A6BNA2_PRIPA|nr:hypothetical protein PRIPAC_86652 [Pristionchus pacificus]|eukprot:PDM67384.1 hypothetical protein PRIPAC_48801 [Pristionchus pacificus]